MSAEIHEWKQVDTQQLIIASGHECSACTASSTVLSSLLADERIFEVRDDSASLVRGGCQRVRSGCRR